MLSGEILKEFIYSRISSPYINTSTPSRDPHHSFNSQRRNLCLHVSSVNMLSFQAHHILTLNLIVEQDTMHKSLLTNKKQNNLDYFNIFCHFLVF